MKQIATSTIGDKNRTRIPNKVLELLPKGTHLEWNQDEETGNIIVFMGHLRIIRNNNGGSNNKHNPTLTPSQTKGERKNV